MGNHSDGLPTGFVKNAQSDGRNWIAHLTTGSLATVLTLVLSMVFGIGGTGPQGPAGVTHVVQQVPVAGICAYFGKDSTGRTRLQLSTPKHDKAGPWCAEGDYISVVPGK